jgi:ribose/xylose/arabinose/galactoside ABC-type transport system permease subunit
MRSKIQINSSIVLVVFLVAVVLGFYLAQPSFLSLSSLNNILIQASAATVAAVGMTFVILLSDIDLSVGATMSLAVVVGVTLTSGGSQFDTTTTVWVIPVAIGVGIACGVLNALLINRLKLNSLIVTLGTASVYLGIALTITEAGTRVLSGTLVDLIALRIGPLNLIVVVVVVITVLAGLFLRLRPDGRLIYAVGGDLRSARESGLSQSKARYIAFGFLGATAAVAGLITIGQVSTIEANLGKDFAFTVITAVVIGGTSLFGGRGGVLGSVLGAVLLATIGSGLNAINASIYVYDVVRGSILVLAVLSDPLISRITARRALLAARQTA